MVPHGGLFAPLFDFPSLVGWAYIEPLRVYTKTKTIPKTIVLGYTSALYASAMQTCMLFHWYDMIISISVYYI